VTEERTGYTTQDVTTLTNAQLIEEALQSGYDSGYYATHSSSSEYGRLGNVAIARRNACFAELKARLAQAERLAEALQSLIVQIDKANFMDELGHPLRMNVAYFSAKDALAARGRQGKEE